MYLFTLICPFKSSIKFPTNFLAFILFKNSMVSSFSGNIGEFTSKYIRVGTKKWKLFL